MKRTVRKGFDLIIALTIFIIAIIHLWGVSKIDPDSPAIISDYGDYHLVYFYPLQNNIIEIVFAIFIIAKAFLFHSCIYTKIAALLYLSISLLSLSHIIFMFEYGIYYETLMILFNLAIIGMAATTLLKCLLRQYMRI